MNFVWLRQFLSIAKITRDPRVNPFFQINSWLHWLQQAKDKLTQSSQIISNLFLICENAVVKLLQNFSLCYRQVFWQHQPQQLQKQQQKQKQQSQINQVLTGVSSQSAS